MNRILVVIRHGKPEPFGLTAGDFERTLVPDGVRESKNTGIALRKAGIKPELFLASAAPRALYTLRFVAGALGGNPDSVVADKALYTAGRSDLLETVRSFPDEVVCAALCGHNPAISDLVLLLAPEESIPFLNTADAAVLEIPSEHWSDAGTVSAGLLHHIWRPARRTS